MLHDVSSIQIIKIRQIRLRTFIVVHICKKIQFFILFVVVLNRCIDNKYAFEYKIKIICVGKL